MKIDSGTFAYRRRAAFADTDAMGVVHHVNYLRYFEEARVAWLREMGIAGLHFPKSDMVLAVLESRCLHFLPVRFEDEVLVYLQARGERLKIHMQYVIVFASEPGKIIAKGMTTLVPVNSSLKPIRQPPALTKLLETSKWTETWL